MLSDLLDERKKTNSLKELESIAKKYHIDIAKLESLARFVNSPTIGEGTTVMTKDANGERTITSTVSLVIIRSDQFFTQIPRLYGLKRLIRTTSTQLPSHRAVCICSAYVRDMTVRTILACRSFRRDLYFPIAMSHSLELVTKHGARILRM
jgi:hypothetical protein